MTSKETAKKRIDFAEEHRDDAATKNFNVSHETLARYRRLLKESPEPQRAANILIFDIETAPMEVYVWGLYKQRINHANVIMDWFILSWSAKWLYSSDIMSDVLTQKEAIGGDDKRICKSMWDLFESADIICGHNAKNFDIRKMGSRWILHGMNPPSPYQVIDTLKESRKMAAHSSHRLDYLGQILHNKGKLETDYTLWKKCKAGDQESLDYMVKYNREDVVLLEEVYLSIRPWIKSHPNMGIYTDSDTPVCANCGSEKIHEVGEYVTPAGAYNSMRCERCGALSRQRISNLTVNKRRGLTISNAR